MKSESEIRKHMEDLRTCAKMPCDCGEKEHAFQCFIGGKMIAAKIGILEWILEDSKDGDMVAEQLSQFAMEFRMSQAKGDFNVVSS